MRKMFEYYRIEAIVSRLVGYESSKHFFLSQLAESESLLMKTFREAAKLIDMCCVTLAYGGSFLSSQHCISENQFVNLKWHQQREKNKL